MAAKPFQKHSPALNALTLDDLDDLMQLVRKNRIEEIEIEGKGVRIRIRGQSNRRGEAAPPPMVALSTLPAAAIAAPAAPAPPVVPAAGQPAPPVPAKSAEGEASAAAAGEAEENLIEIKSPMVGTFYRAPSPDSPPYVEIGDRITEDTVLCIVEAMKLMNEIKAEVSGVVKKVLAENGHPVEFGQTMFLIAPSE